MTKCTLLSFSAALLLGCASANAGTIPVYSTGVGSPGADDPYWTVTSPSSGTSAAKILSLQNVWPFWAQDNNGSNSRWIAPVDAFAQPNAPYTYSQTFDLTGFDPNTASITGLWYVDDTGTLSLNGHSLGTESNSVLDPGQFDNPPATLRVPFSIGPGSGFFVAGVNTLSVNVTQVDQFADGLRVTITSAAADVGSADAPEPGSIGLVLSGVVALGLRLRRRSA